MHFAARKNVLEYDDVMNLQRVAIYDERNAILDGKDMSERIPEIVRDAVEAVVEENCPDKTPTRRLGSQGRSTSWVANMTGRDRTSRRKPSIMRTIRCLSGRCASSSIWTTVFSEKAEQLGEPIVKMLESQVMLRIIDTRWMAHLSRRWITSKSGIGLARLRAARPACRVQERGVQRLPEPHGLHVRGLSAHAAASAGSRASRSSLRLPRRRAPLDGKVSYSSPEQALEQTGVAAARAPGACQASNAGGQTTTPPKPAPAKPQTYRQGQGRSVRQRGAQRSVPVWLRA